jgi:hypothetical protein
MANPEKCPRCERPIYDLEGPGPVDPNASVCTRDESHFWCLDCTCPAGDSYSCNGPFPRVLPQSGWTTNQWSSVKMSCDDRRLVSTSGWGDIGSRLRLQWIGNAIRAAEEVTSDNCSWSTRLLWWVHLYAILGELKEFLVDLSIPLFVGDPARRGPFVQAVKRIEALQQVFTEDELLYLQYRRDEACHPVADSYEPRVRDGKVKKAKETLLGVRPLSDIRRATERVLKAANNDEIRLAKEMATRCLPALRDVLSGARPLFS